MTVTAVPHPARNRPAGAAPATREFGPALLAALRRDPLALFTRLRAEHGPIVRLRTVRLPLYLVSDPAAIQDALTMTHRAYAKGLPGRDPAGAGEQPLARVLGRGLLTSTAELHRRQRRLIQPMFHHQRIAGYADIVSELAAATGASWRDGQRRDLHRDMSDLTLAIIARTVFDVDLDTVEVDTIRRALEVNLATARRAGLPGARLLDRLPLPSTRRWRAALGDLDAVVYRLVAQRRAAGLTGHDLLSLLMSARDADTGEPMPDDLVRDEALTILLAGHETTANALAWSLHLLGADPRAQTRLGAELEAVLGERTATMADLPRLPYTKAVFCESMRLYPPAWVMARRLTADRDVCGYRLPAGAVLLLSPWVVHRDPTWWPEPTRFRPERWLPDAEADAGDGVGAGARPRYAYFPFGGGSRQCIGNAFAEMEGVLTLAMLCRRWRVSPASAAPVVPAPSVTLRPRHGLEMTVHAVGNSVTARRNEQ